MLDGKAIGGLLDETAAEALLNFVTLAAALDPKFLVPAEP